jgi:AAA+ ATPase superfamily predicted ATPase
MNPFIISGYHSPAYFCDREKETEKIITALENDRNITLISPRRMGKTGLIHHVFHHINQKNKDIKCFYLDIFATQNLYDFTLLFAKTVFGKLDHFSEAIMKQILTFLKSCRPAFSYDPITQQSKITFDIQPQNTEASLQEIFEYLKHSNARCYIAIDEFQQITEYPEKGVEALLRSYMQFLPNVRFIFAGSKKHIMDTIFSSANRPFYQSTQKVGLHPIPIETYRKFTIDIFKKSGSELEEFLFDDVYNMMLGHTWYIQNIMNQLYALNKSKVTSADVETIITDILEEENATYKTYCELISRGQLKLLKSIAHEKQIVAPFENGFMKKHELSAPSSVRQALNALIDKNLVLTNETNGYFVYDRFFSLWLEKN